MKVYVVQRDHKKVDLLSNVGVFWSKRKAIKDYEGQIEHHYQALINRYGADYVNVNRMKLHFGEIAFIETYNLAQEKWENSNIFRWTRLPIF